MISHALPASAFIRQDTVSPILSPRTGLPYTVLARRCSTWGTELTQNSNKSGVGARPARGSEVAQAPTNHAGAPSMAHARLGAGKRRQSRTVRTNDGPATRGRNSVDGDGGNAPVLLEPGKSLETPMRSTKPHTRTLVADELRSLLARRFSRTARYRQLSRVRVIDGGLLSRQLSVRGITLGMGMRATLRLLFSMPRYTFYHLRPLLGQTVHRGTRCAQRS